MDFYKPCFSNVKGFDMMGTRRFAVTALVMTMLLSAKAFAANETLSIQRMATGEYEAVISGMKNGCEEISVPTDIPFESPSGTTANGNVISILSPLFIGFCGVQPPRVPYQTIANMGGLAEGSYEVHWYIDSISEPIRVLSAQFVAGPSTAFSAPASSMMSLIVLGVCIASFGLRRQASIGKCGVHA